ncbi:ATP-grasp fold amidoligase family protein [Belnapia rosea]|uniref:ATP-grasp fold amidoligase family protein n=1 Tax=Belnapia rosea TaxID=938405 RepID=UPI00088FC58C|nr:ATP-grasp fold amidoligase family protein [Belnapia rosea]SDB38174.1 TupA-like ATPgrasp [Belnapia rosea]
MTQTGSIVPGPLRHSGLTLLRQVFHHAADRLEWLDRLRASRRLRRMMREALGYDPDLRRPRSFNERIAWKILNDRNPLIPLTLDKVAVRPWAAERIGWRYITPLVGVWDSAAAIPWEALPQRFVLKANHGSGYNILVPDKVAACRSTIMAQAEAWLSENYGERTGEWGYRPIRPRLLVEEFLAGPAGGVPEDYKVYVFGGRPRLLQVHLGRFTERRRELFYDPVTLEPLAFGRHRHADCPDYPGPPPATAALNDLAARLGAGFDAVRVDLYLIEGKPRFGEMTHYSGGSAVPFGTPEEDRMMGELWAEAIGEQDETRPVRASIPSALEQLLHSSRKARVK